ncbi:MAG: NAD(P)H-dependent oxidoreductase [Fusobacteriaceae bacterium]|jgi:multimeric flavodoxin WrbA|nr:NAD(P)H-dependent oxidoreductase [Fusobacteriaceae bacterium]
MKIAMINGSQKKKTSVTGILLKNLEALLLANDPQLAQDISFHAVKSEKINILEYGEVLSADVLVLGFPLYIDSVPSQLLRFLKAVENAFHNKETRIYAVINAGFYEGTQCKNAVSILKNWAAKAEVSWGQAVAAGGGPMLFMTKLQNNGPTKTILQGLRQLGKHILLREEAEDLYLSPAIPRFFYSFTAHQGWKKAVRARGLRPRDLGRKVELEEETKKS